MFNLAPENSENDPCAVALTVLAGEGSETLFGDAHRIGCQAGIDLAACGRWRVGRASVTIEEGLEPATRRLYDALLCATAGLHLCRVWNYVPRINQSGPDGLENYRAFCLGRALAFETGYGSRFKERLSAASAVGADDGRLTVMFAACAGTPRHFENASQVPAYEYPGVHGPRPPSFARATVVPDGPGRADVFISGTAAVEGHETVAEGDTLGQVPCTLRNLEIISRTCGLDGARGDGGAGERHIKVYLRNDYDLQPVSQALEGRLVRPGDRVSYLRADLCRSGLNLEIEVTILGATIG